MREKLIPVDLARFPPQVSLVSKTGETDKIIVAVCKAGEPVDITGEIKARMILQDGTMATEDGVVSGNQAYVILPDEVYEEYGGVTIFIRLIDGDSTTTLATVTLSVREVVQNEV